MYGERKRRKELCMVNTSDRKEDIASKETWTWEHYKQTEGSILVTQYQTLRTNTIKEKD